MAEAEPPPLTGRKLFLAGFAIALANFIVVLDLTIANVSVPHIAGGLAISPTQGTWVITSYAVADAISVILSGWLASRIGAVRLFVICLVGFGLFSLLCGLSTTLTSLVIFRICQGLVGGPLMPLSQSLLLRIFSRDRAPLATAIWAITTICAPIIGPILGGWISDGWSWPWIFFINLPIVALCVVAAVRLLNPFETAAVRAPIDVVGLILLIVWVGAVQIMLDTGRDQDWFASSSIIAMAVVAAIGFGAFIIWEWTAPNPVVDLHLFRSRTFAISTVATALGYGAFFASIVLMPLWLQQIVGYSSLQSGYVLAFAGVLAVVVAPIAARLIGKVDIRALACFGVLWLATISLLRAQWTLDADFWTLVWPQLLQGVGMPFFFIGMTTLAMSSVATRALTSAAGILAFTRTMSGAIGAALVTTGWDITTRVARSDIVGRLNDPEAALAKIQASGLTVDQSRAVLDRMVDVQASTIGASQIHLLACAAFSLAAIILWFAPKPDNINGPADTH